MAIPFGNARAVIINLFDYSLIPKITELITALTAANRNADAANWTTLRTNVTSFRNDVNNYTTITEAEYYGQSVTDGISNFVGAQKHWLEFIETTMRMVEIALKELNDPLDRIADRLDNELPTITTNTTTLATQTTTVAAQTTTIATRATTIAADTTRIGDTIVRDSPLITADIDEIRVQATSMAASQAIIATETDKIENHLDRIQETIISIDENFDYADDWHGPHIRMFTRSAAEAGRMAPIARAMLMLSLNKSPTGVANLAAELDNPTQIPGFPNL